MSLRHLPHGQYKGMSEIPEPSTVPHAVAAPPPPRVKPPALYAAAAWVVIVAGVVFVVAVIFFSGLFLGWSSGIRSGWHHSYDGGRYGGCPMMEPGAMMGPGGMHPGGPIGPSQLPTTSVPATPHP